MPGNDGQSNLEEVSSERLLYSLLVKSGFLAFEDGFHGREERDNSYRHKGGLVVKKEICLAVFVALIALPLSAANNVIYQGIDLFRTPDDGRSFMDFSNEPIPAGFFCRESAPFTGKVLWKGVPVSTSLSGELRQTDTIVQRLDDAPFNKRGVAKTRIQVRALQLESVDPIKTACGSFKVRVVLDGPQPITSMRIVRTGEYGGRFLARLTVRAKFVFTPVSGLGKQLELPAHEIRFPENPRFTWAFSSNTKGLKRSGKVMVDTNFDSVPDTFLPGTSNFAAGWNGTLDKEDCPPYDQCHLHDSSCMHCIGAVQ